MDSSPEKRGSGRVRKSQAGQDSNGWDCSVCTFQNSAEAFKCDMCDTRKGTSTRKPRTNQQQVLIHQVSQQQNKKEKSLRKHKYRSKSDTVSATSTIPVSRRPARLKNVDRSSAHHMVVTVGDVTVIITDYKLKSVSAAEPSTSTVDDSLVDDLAIYSTDTDSN